MSPDPSPYFAKFITGHDSVEMSTWLTDLELMHQYTSLTYTTLPRSHELQSVWQVEVPKLALTNVFLLHQVLAVSAYHITYLHPDRRSLPVCASQHQNKTIAGLRTAIAQINKDNCPAIFVASSFLFICAFSRFGVQKNVEQPRIDDLLDVFLLVKGMSNILDAHSETLRTSSVGKLFLKEGSASSAPFLSTLVQQLRQLPIPDSFEPSSVLVCRQSIDSIITWIDNSIRTTEMPEMRIAISWPLSVTEDFLNLVRQCHPVALGILACYAVVLHHKGKDHWFLVGWGRSIFKNISDCMDSQCMDLLDWPRMMIEGG